METIQHATATTRLLGLNLPAFIVLMGAVGLILLGAIGAAITAGVSWGHFLPGHHRIDPMYVHTELDVFMDPGD